MHMSGSPCHLLVHLRFQFPPQASIIVRFEQVIPYCTVPVRDIYLTLHVAAQEQEKLKNMKKECDGQRVIDDLSYKTVFLKS
jgi:hypothetical protein